MVQEHSEGIAQFDSAKTLLFVCLIFLIFCSRKYKVTEISMRYLLPKYIYIGIRIISNISSTSSTVGDDATTARVDKPIKNALSNKL